MWKYNNTDELYHYGVPGMRWGHRKAQIMSVKNGKKKSKKIEDIIPSIKLKKEKKLTNEEIGNTWKEHNKICSISASKIRKMSEKEFDKYMDNLSDHQNKLKTAELSRTPKEDRDWVGKLMEVGFRDETADAMSKRFGY